jgi:hypothetical protein
MHAQDHGDATLHATGEAASACNASMAAMSDGPQASSPPTPSTSPVACQRVAEPSCVIPRA